MNNMVSKTDELIKYLIRVFNGTELTSESKKEQEKYGDYTKEDEIVRSQDFFILTKDLDKILEPWFGGFENDEELNKTLKFKLGVLKKLSFPKGKDVFFLVEDKTNHNNVIFTKQRHDDYSHIIHSHLIEVFEEKLKELNAEAISNNPYPLLFVSGEIYEKFISFCSRPMVDYYLEISYLKKRMEHESLIHRIKDNDFMKIIFQEMKLISKKNHADYLIKNKLTSLNKSATENRENYFNHIFLD